MFCDSLCNNIIKIYVEQLCKNVCKLLCVDYREMYFMLGESHEKKTDSDIGKVEHVDPK